MKNITLADAEARMVKLEEKLRVWKRIAVAEARELEDEERRLEKPIQQEIEKLQSEIDNLRAEADQDDERYSN